MGARVTKVPLLAVVVSIKGLATEGRPFGLRASTTEALKEGSLLSRMGTSSGFSKDRASKHDST